jgi:hypothetical protein
VVRAVTVFPMTTSRKSLLFVAASAVVLSLFASGPASADAPVAVGTKSDKKKCGTVGPLRHTFRLRNDETSPTVLYKVSVKIQHCLVYRMESRIYAGGRTLTQPSVKEVRTKATVSHSGYVPEANGKPNMTLLPGNGDIVSDYMNVHIVEWSPSRNLFGFYLDDPSIVHSGYGQLSVKTAWEELQRAGFMCPSGARALDGRAGSARPGKCRPVKKSVSMVDTVAFPTGGARPVGSGRLYMESYLGLLTGDPLQPDRKSDESLLYWDKGFFCDPAPEGRCPAGVRPQNSFKGESDPDWSAESFAGVPRAARVLLDLSDDL